MLSILITVMKQTTKIYNEYPSIEKKDKIECRISSIGEFKGATLVTNSKGRKFSFHGYSEDINPPYANNYCQIGDSLFKEPHSENIILIKSDGSRISFKLLLLE